MSYERGQAVEVRNNGGWVPGVYEQVNEGVHYVHVPTNGGRCFRNDSDIRPAPSSPPAEPAWFSVVTVLGGEYANESQAISQAKRCAEANVGRAYYVVVLPKEHAIAEPAKAEWREG